MLVYLYLLYLYLQISILQVLQVQQQLLLFRSTNNVLSNIDLISTFPICGFLYGGNSSTNDAGTPFNIVFDNIFEINIVINIPSSTINKTTTVAIIDEFPDVNNPPTNMLAIVIKNGNLPLQGTKALVSIEINFSLGESIILHPVTPAQLQPNPIHIVNACFPRTSRFSKIFI